MVTMTNSLFIHIMYSKQLQAMLPGQNLRLSMRMILSLTLKCLMSKRMEMHYVMIMRYKLLLSTLLCAYGLLTKFSSFLLKDEGDAKSWACFTQRISRAPEQVLR